MGSNMARHLKDRQFPIAAIYDINRARATSVAAEIGCAASQDLSEVTAASDVIFTVVTDDRAVHQIFAGSGDNLLVNARGKLFINCETISPGWKSMSKSWRIKPARKVLKHAWPPALPRHATASST